MTTTMPIMVYCQKFTLFTYFGNRLFDWHRSTPQGETDTEVRERHDGQWHEVDGSKEEDLVAGLLLVRPAWLTRRQEVTVHMDR